MISKKKAIATKNIQQTHTNDSNSAKTAKRSGQDGLEGDITQLYLRLAIDCSSDSVSGKHTFQTIQSIIKIILRSKEGLTIIPPTSQEVPVIKGNLELPGKGNTRLMHRYIHQGRIIPNTFAGKILVSHSVGYSILSSDVTMAVTSNHPGAKISCDKFRISNLIKIGVLCGTFKHESQQALTAYLEAALSKQKNTGYIPIRVTWESIYVDGKNSTSVEAIFIKCRVEDVAVATVALSCLYGSTTADRDPFCPLVRFIPMAVLKSSEPVTLQVIVRLHQFLKSTCSTTQKNTRLLECQIKIPHSSKTTTLAALLQSIKDAKGATLFHTVGYNMNRTNQIKSFWHLHSQM